MKKYKWILFINLTVLMIASAIQAQTLISSKLDLRDYAVNEDLMWYEQMEDDHLALVPTIDLIDLPKSEFTVLESDVETKRFILVENRFGSEIFPEVLDLTGNEKVIWQGKTKILLRIRSNEYMENLSENFVSRRLTFTGSWQTNQSANSYQSHVSLSKPSADITDILEDISIEELYKTEEHLTGEKAFWLNNQWDSIQTRYTYSPQIYKAQNYIQTRLEDFGYTVELQPFNLSTFQDVQFANDQTGWLINDGGEIYGTENSGEVWDVQDNGAANGMLWSVFAQNTKIAFAVGENGLVLKTSDGKNWAAQRSNSSKFLFGVHFIDDENGWICGDEGLLLKSVNGGSSWTSVPAPTVDRLYDITFINDSTGWAVGRNGTIIKTSDGGKIWKKQNLGAVTRLYGVHFLDQNIGFVVGWSGTLLKTINGGEDWTIVDVPLVEYFYDIDFFDSNTGMIVGWNGTCLMTTDGGESWEACGNIQNSNYFGFDLVDENTALVAGEKAFVKTEDQGAIWNSQISKLSLVSLNNIIAQKTGKIYPDIEYIVCAHYDATSQEAASKAPGADDNGSGTSAVIEAARVLADYDFNYTVKFVLFPGEEQGLHGSDAYAAIARDQGDVILGVLNMDMIAYDGNKDGVVEIHAGRMESSQVIGQNMVDNIQSFGLDLTAKYKTSSSSSASDHASFWKYGYPAIMHIEDFEDFTPFYHTTNDLLSTLDPDYFLANARLTIGTLALLADIDSTLSGFVLEVTTPHKFKLSDPYPNPFNPSTVIEYQITEPGFVDVTVSNIVGEKIVSLQSGKQVSGTYRLQWKGQNKNGLPAATGVYIIRMQYEDKAQSKKVLLMR